MAFSDCGCQAGRTYLIDPNKASGQGLSVFIKDGKETLFNNGDTFVPPEDLNIYVELTTTKKARSVLNVSDKGKLNTESSPQGTTKISFIDGSPNGEFEEDGTPKKSMTTRYTELTTDFNKSPDTENLGITNIDIDFNSSYAPLVKIDFVDVRGAALMQQGNKSPYALFFDLPYPIFELKVKGYYGKAVKYCLHMTKWNSKFNSETGNFEITADFIGYTYAMLTDMLLGYLRAVTRTPAGKAKFEAMYEELAANKETTQEKLNSFVTISQLLTKIENVNLALQKFKQEDKDVKELAKNKDVKNVIANIEDRITETIKFIQKDNQTIFSKDGLFIINNPSNNGGVSYAESNEQKFFTEYQNSIGGIINDLEESLNDVVKLDKNKFTTNVKSYNDVTWKDIHNESSDTYNTIYNSLRNRSNEREFDACVLIQEIKDQLSNEEKDTKFDVYNFRSAIKALSILNKQLDENEVSVKEALATKVTELVSGILGFKPTIRNIFSIFTTHVEIFLECLYDVSHKAETDADGRRKTQFDKLDKKDLDIKAKDTSDDTATGWLPPKIYPWPLYREQNPDDVKRGAYEEAWLGGKNAIDKPFHKDVPELTFVEDLLEGLLEVNRDDNTRLNAIGGIVGDSWYAVNPLDTKLFGNNNSAYSNPNINNKERPEDIYKLAMVRAFTFIGLNRHISKEEVIAMGAFEANAAYKFTLNTEVKRLISSYGNSDKTDEQVDALISAFVDGSTILKEGENSPFMKDSSDNWEYTWIGDDTLGNILPINGTYDRTPFYLSGTKTPAPISSVLENKWTDDNTEGDLFTGPVFSGDNGAVFVNIFTSDEYTKNIKGDTNYDNESKLLADVNNFNGGKIINLRTLKKTKIDNDDSSRLIGVNVFGGLHGTTEFSSVNFDNCNGCIKPNGVDTAPNSFMFFDNTIKVGLARSQEYNDYKGEREPLHKSFDKFNDIDLFRSSNNTYAKIRLGAEDNMGHTEYGRTRELLGLNIVNDNNIVIPSIDFFVNTRTTSFQKRSFSLFGSQLYFEQRRSHNPTASRALLFLHAMPWNNLFNDNVNLGNEGQFGSIFDNGEYNTIINMFAQRTGFVEAPRSWVAFIGGLLWRADKSDIIIGELAYQGGSSLIDPIVWGNKLSNSPNNITGAAISDFDESFLPNDGSDDYLDLSFYPERTQYLTSTVASGPLEFDSNSNYKILGDVLENLPVSVKTEFKRIFFEFVNSGNWGNIRESLEIFPKAWDVGNEIVQPDGFVDQNQLSGGTISWKKAYTNLTSPITQLTSTNLSGYWTYITKPKGSDIISKHGNTRHYCITQSAKNIFRNLGEGGSISDFGPIGRINPSRDGNGRQTNPSDDITRYNKILNNFDLTIKDDGGKDNKVQERLKDIFTETVYIGNSSTKIWIPPTQENKFGFQENVLEYSDRDKVLVKKGLLKQYFKSFINTFKDLDKIDTTNEDDKDKQEIFNTMDDDTIRLNIYRHCKALYDKWIAGSGPDVIFQCGTRNAKDTVIANADGRTKPKLIDSFRFVNRAFNDLGDDFLINPIIIRDILTKNYNQSFYDLISRVLADNNFNFIPLPAYIDYDKPDEMCKMFEPNIFNDEANEDISGPSFVCVYVGQTSNKLDLGNGSDFPNDGFDIICDENGNITGLPADFTGDKKDGEHNIAVFSVNYGHQNQNIFSDIKLDQQEFSETDESLVITDSIAQRGSQSNKTFAGQNLWNVYQVRSYSTEITALGNAQIQPMMYFQLNNIPMFHGAYMIIHAKHSIIPNHMKTTFKGVRIRYIDSPLIKAETLYMSLLGALSDVDGSDVTVGSRSVPEISYLSNNAKLEDGINYNYIRVFKEVKGNS